MFAARPPTTVPTFSATNGTLREVLAVGRALGLELRAEIAERHDGPAGRLDGVPADVRIGAVGGDPVEGEPEAKHSLVQREPPELRRLADDHVPRDRGRSEVSANWRAPMVPTSSS